jgi:hypothetical protein
MIRKFLQFTLFASQWLLVFAAIAADHAQEHEQHGTHVHGEATLLVAIDGNTVELEFSSPAMNIVGFEHRPESDEQVRAVAQAITLLGDADGLFVMPAEAGCKLLASDVESSLADQAHSDHDDHQASEAEQHSDFAAHYRIECVAAEKLKALKLNHFELFKGMDVIEAQVYSGRGQSKVDLTAEHASLEF